MKNYLLICLIVSALLIGCDKPRVGYEIGLHEAYDRLRNSEFKDFLAMEQCGILIHLQADGEPDHSVTYHISSSGEEMLSFTATLVPVNDKETKVDVTVSHDPNGKEAYDGNQFYPRPAVQQPVRLAINEQVAALLEGRAFDVAHIANHPDDSVCNIQRGGLESGVVRFSIHDKPGTASQ